MTSCIHPVVQRHVVWHPDIRHPVYVRWNCVVCHLEFTPVRLSWWAQRKMTKELQRELERGVPNQPE